MKCPRCNKELKEENFAASVLDQPEKRLTILECKNEHAFMITWEKMTIVELVPASQKTVHWPD
jgi:hypothetical protein